MDDAKATLLKFLAVYRNTEEAAAMFAEDGAFELPYLTSVGIQARYVGRQEVKRFLDLVLELYPDMSFNPEDIHVLIDTPDQAFAEYVARPTAAATGRRIIHLFMGRIVVQRGEIRLLREGLNTVAAAQALLPGGPAEISVPDGVVKSF
jgi:hypothetical protein